MLNIVCVRIVIKYIIHHNLILPACMLIKANEYRDAISTRTIILCLKFINQVIDNKKNLTKMYIDHTKNTNTMQIAIILSRYLTLIDTINTLKKYSYSATYTSQKMLI